VKLTAVHRLLLRKILFGMTECDSCATPRVPAKVRTRPVKADGVLIQTSARALPCARRAGEF
jgi:hypothetical protein